MVIKHLTWGLASLLFVCYAEQQTFMTLYGIYQICIVIYDV